MKLFVKLNVRSGQQRALTATLLAFLTACSSGVRTELPLEPTSHETYLKVAVRADADDAEELRSGVMVGKGSYDLDFSQDGRKVGLRFTDLAVPKGAEITRAYLGFEVASSDSGDTVLTVRAEDSHTPRPFTRLARDISSRKTTSAAVFMAAFSVARR